MDTTRVASDFEQTLFGAPQLALRLLGGFALRIEGEPLLLAGPSQRVVAFLSLHDDGPIRRSYVAGTLWPESTEIAARSNLRSALSRLGPIRREMIATTSDTLSLRPGIEIDLVTNRVAARHILDQSRDFVAFRPSDFAADLLPDWEDTWVEPERESYRQLRLHALETLSGHLLGEGRFGEAVDAALTAALAAPLRESAHLAVIRALYAEGNRAEAMSHFRQMRGLLNEELGIEPSFDFSDLLIDTEAPRDPRG